MTTQRRLSAILYFLFLLSGAAALGYQLVWSKLFAVGLGHEMASVLAVVCAFMGGMALGAWAVDRRISISPMRSLAAIELVVGIWGIVTAFALPLLNNFALHLSGLGSPARQWVVCFAFPFLILLPATMAMGASFPVMERCISKLQASGQRVAGVYGMNTFGAAAGTYLSIFWIAPAAGFRATLLWLAGINVLCAVAAFALSIRVANNRQAPMTTRERETPCLFTQKRLVVSLFFTGLFGMAVETVGVRVLSQILENTVYSFAAVLAVFLLGTAAGAGVLHRLARLPSPQILTVLLCAMGLSLLLSIAVLSRGPAIYDFTRSHAGQGRNPMIGAELFLVILVLGIPSAFMGATFSLLAQIWRNVRGSVGLAAAINTAGAALGPLIFSLLILPLLGAKWAFVLLAGGYFLLLPAVNRFAWVSIALFALTLLFLPRDLRILDLPPQGRLVEYHDGIMASAAVVEDVTKHRTLRVNNHFQMGGTGAADAEYRHAHIPLLLHPNPHRALILGVGTGITLGGAAIHPNLKADGVELLPEVVQVIPQFEPYNHSPRQNTSVQIYTADARRFVKLTEARYDVIIADLFHPAADGAGNLYTVEHFRSMRDRLAPDGFCCQWLPLHQLDLPMFRVITKTFLEVFPDTQAWLLRFNVDAPVVGLIGTLQPQRYPTNWIEQRLTGNPVETEIKRLALADSIRFFGHYLAGPRELTTFCGDASINTDDHPIVIFRAPEFVYQKSHTTYGRLLALIHDLKAGPGTMLSSPLSGETPGVRDDFNDRLQAYFAARNVYITGLVAEVENQPEASIDAFIESARLSSDFTSGYAQCLTLASLEVRSNPTKARRLLERLIEAQPSRPVAREMLDRLPQK